MKTFSTYSFGCRVNQAEIEEISKKLISNGFSFESNNPNFYIINTCAVTQKAEREASKLIRSIKRKLPNTKIIVIGCAATHWQKNNHSLATKADLIVDNLNKDFLIELINKKSGFSKAKYFTPKMSISDTFRSKYLYSNRMILKIQDGCNRFCTYCIIPYLRGKPKSSILETIVSKIREIEKDINEVVLTAINTEAYGIDTRDTLISLIDNILKQTKIKRLSFGSINPWSINDKFLSFYKTLANSERFVDYFHIPIQSASNKILKLMKREYTKEELQEKFESLYRLNPHIYFGTDIITGFLEEGEREFEETYKFLENSPIAKFHVFRFSRRQHTSAYYLSETHKEPSESVKIYRSRALIKLGKKKYQQFQKKLISKNFEAMFIKPAKDGFQEALLENQMPVMIKVAKDYFGEIKEIKVTDLKKDKLIGKIG